MARVIALSGDHLKKINSNYTSKLNAFKESFKDTASAAVELGKEVGATLDNAMSNAVLGVYESGQELKDIITGNAYRGVHTTDNVVNQPVIENEPVVEQTNREILSQMEPNMQPVNNEVKNDEEILNIELDENTLNDNTLLHQGFVQLEAAKSRWDHASSILKLINVVLKKNDLSAPVKADITKFLEIQKNAVRKYYDEYLVEEARFDVLKEKVLRGMHEFVDTNTFSNSPQNEVELTNGIGNEIGNMSTGIIGVQPVENVQNGIRF